MWLYEISQPVTTINKIQGKHGWRSGVSDSISTLWPIPQLCVICDMHESLRFSRVLLFTCSSISVLLFNCKILALAVLAKIKLIFTYKILRDRYLGLIYTFIVLKWSLFSIIIQTEPEVIIVVTHTATPPMLPLYFVYSRYRSLLWSPRSLFF
jgi:hypothetical protein